MTDDPFLLTRLHKRSLAPRTVERQDYEIIWRFVDCKKIFLRQVRFGLKFSNNYRADFLLI